MKILLYALVVGIIINILFWIFSKEKNFRTFNGVVGLVWTVFLMSYFYFFYENKPFVDLPEEISQAETGDLLQVESTVGDTIKVGFARNRTEYAIELIDQKYVKIDNGVEFKIIPFDSINAYIEKDNE